MLGSTCDDVWEEMLGGRRLCACAVDVVPTSVHRRRGADEHTVHAVPKRTPLTFSWDIFVLHLIVNSVARLDFFILSELLSLSEGTKSVKS